MKTLLVVMASVTALCVSEPLPSTTTVPPLAEHCEPSYPDFCITADADALICGDVGAEFTVLPPDPYGFDEDGNGVGCET